MHTWMRWACVAAALASITPGLAIAAEFTGEKVVPLTKDGIVPLDLEVGPVTFHELVVQGVPEAQELASLPGDKSLDPRPWSVSTNRGSDEVEMRFVATFLDDQGASVFTCSVARVEQDEETANETRRVCPKLSAGSVKAAQWAKVTSVKFEVSLFEKD